MEDELQQSLLISEENDCLLNVPPAPQGSVNVPFNLRTRRFSFIESLEPAAATFRNFVDGETMQERFRDMEANFSYEKAPLWFNWCISLVLVAVVVVVKFVLLLAWFFVLLDPLVLLGGVWIVKQVVILVCVVRQDWLNRYRNTLLRKRLAKENEVWRQYRLRWSMDPQGHYLTLCPQLTL